MKKGFSSDLVILIITIVLIIIIFVAVQRILP